MRISDWSSDVCSSDLPQAVRDRGLDRGVFAAIGKRIRGHIDDAKHPRPIELEDAAGAVELWGGVEHVVDLKGCARLPSRTHACRPERMPVTTGTCLYPDKRTAERRGGTDGVSTCRSAWAP